MSVPVGIVCSPEDYIRSIDQPDALHCLTRGDTIGLTVSQRLSVHQHRTKLKLEQVIAIASFASVAAIAFVFFVILVCHAALLRALNWGLQLFSEMSSGDGLKAHGNRCEYSVYQ